MSLIIIIGTITPVSAKSNRLISSEINLKNIEIEQSRTLTNIPQEVQMRIKELQSDPLVESIQLEGYNNIIDNDTKYTPFSNDYVQGQTYVGYKGYTYQDWRLFIKSNFST